MNKNNTKPDVVQEAVEMFWLAAKNKREGNPIIPPHVHHYVAIAGGPDLCTICDFYCQAYSDIPLKPF